MLNNDKLWQVQLSYPITEGTFHKEIFKEDNQVIHED